MRARPIVFGILTALVIGLLAPDSRAESKQVVDKIVALNKAAVASFGAGAHEKAKEQLMEAVVLGKENGLGMHAAMARTYVHLGVVYVDGLKDNEKGQRYFAMAQKVRSDIEVTPALASKTVLAVFQAARGPDAARTAAAAKPEAKPEAEAKSEPPAEKVANAEEAKPSAAERKKAEAAERKKAEAEAKLLQDREKLQNALSAAADGEKKTLADKDRLQKELGQKEKQLAEKEKQLAEKEKQLAEKEKQLADARAGEKKEREARERLEKLNQENGKLIAEAAGREKKEREAKEKLEQARMVAEKSEKERKEREEKDRAAREKLAEGPDLPGSIPQPLYCATKEEGIIGAELFVHCVPQSQVKAKSVVLYYRPSGVAHFDAITMTHGKKGWWTSSVPANRVSGKTLQYYVEARGMKEEVAATNGKADSPNIMPLRTAADAAKAGPAPDLLLSVAKAPAKAPAKATKAAARKTPAAKRAKARR